MPKNTRRITVTRTVTYKATIDLPGHPNKTDAEVLTLLGGSSGNTGTLAIGELLAGSELTNNGTITKAAWSATGTSTNIEPYGTRAKNTALPLGARVVSTKPPAGKEAALGKVFVVTAIAAATNGGKTANSDAEPSWTVTDGDATTDGGVTYRTVPKFAAPVTYAASTAYDKGTVLRPSANSAKEYLVTTANTAAASTPVWVNADTPGATVAFQTGGSAVCIAGCKTYAFLTSFALGDIVKPNSTSTQEYLVTVPGKTNANVLENTEAATPVAVAVGGSVTHGSATFLRIV